MASTPNVSILHAEFHSEVRELAQLPPLGPPEVAIAGRSNVGKSTLLNRLTGRHALARVSKTPGRTRGLVMFDVSLRWAAGQDPRPMRLVDLPGYGYAQVPKPERLAWQVLVEGYVKSRSALAMVLVLLDARRDVGEEELQLIEWLSAMKVPCHVVITKSDKLSASERGLVIARLKKQLAGKIASTQLVSGLSGEGIESIWQRVAQVLDTVPNSS